MNTTAGPALVAAIDDDVDRLLRAEPDVREDLPDSVHQMRVATRRLRSVLRSYRKVLRASAAGEIREELRWLAGLLGEARDAEVRGERFAALLEEYRSARPGDRSEHSTPLAEAPSAPDGNRKAQLRTIRGLVKHERALYVSAHERLLTELDGPRYARLRTALLDLRRDPPLHSRRAGSEATRVFSTVLRDDFGGLRRLVRDEAAVRADPAVGESERIEHLHDIRKYAKRLRYSAEAAAQVLGDPATELAERAKKLQSVLGDHRDAIEAMTTIHLAAGRSRAASTSAFDRLYQSEADAARKALEQYPAATEFVRTHYHR
ncbi:CHAD domain-containing protein [Nocardia alni]|uniref:CHAD domain-containing protein n=1 Tax=Nocardia alni TaxID=2815723 RepID=UPI001C21BD30|nr:CHAD domain-containing protein [Nocardia alni]